MRDHQPELEGDPEPIGYNRAARRAMARSGQVKRGHPLPKATQSDRPKPRGDVGPVDDLTKPQRL